LISHLNYIYFANNLQKAAIGGKNYTQILRLKKRKKLDPLKSVISQPLRDADFLGPSRLQD